MQQRTYYMKRSIIVTSCYSILLSLFAGIWTLITILGFIAPALQDIMTILYIVVALIWGGLTTITIFKYFKMPLVVAFISLVLLLAYYFTVNFSSYSTTAEFKYYFCMVILPLIITQVRINAKVLLLTTMMIPLFGFPAIDSLMFIVSQEGDLGMGVSYAFMLPAIATIVYLFCFIKHDSLRMKCFVIFLSTVNFIFLFMIISYGSRGVVLSLIMEIFLLYLLPYSRIEHRIKRKRKLVIIGIVTVFLAFNFWSILETLNTVLNDFGIYIYGISRSIEYHQMGDALTGRSYISEITWNAICKQPIYGHGIETFFAYSHYRIEYIHNSILQILFDGGLILFVLILFPLIRSIKNWMTKCSFNDFIMVITLFGASVPSSMFSHDLWHIPILWMFVGYTLRYYK